MSFSFCFYTRNEYVRSVYIADTVAYLLIITNDKLKRRTLVLFSKYDVHCVFCHSDVFTSQKNILLHECMQEKEEEKDKRKRDVWNDGHMLWA